MNLRTTAVFALLASVGLAGGAFAQSTGAPAGQAPVTAPAGDEGTAGLGNEQRAIDAGEAAGIKPGTRVEDVDPRAAPRERVPAPPPQR